jgi:hypothetical protein
MLNSAKINRYKLDKYHLAKTCEQMNTSQFRAEGGCTCGHVRYTVNIKPLIVHCCHCRWCQRETGSAFVLNALIENPYLQCTQGEISVIKTPTLSGRGQKIARCPQCHVALWSHYSWNAKILFLRVGTLDNPDLMPPDIHIYTQSKQPWVVLPEGVLFKLKFYSVKSVWPEESLRRIAALKEQSSS